MQPDMSRYVRTWHARSKHTAHARWVYYTITPNTIANPPSTSLCLSKILSVSEASAGIHPVLGGVLPLIVVQDGKLVVLERAHDVLEQHPSAQ